MNRRLLWADITRILAIYLILVLHVNAFPNASQTNFIYCIGLTLANTCVPLLIMVSGALLLGKKESYTSFFRKRVVKVIIPWITWTCVFTLVALYFQAHFSPKTVVHIFRSIFIPFFWFIVLVCSLYLITPALRIFAQNAKKKDILLVILIWYSALSLLPYMRNTQAFPLYVGNGIVQLVINFIGYFLLGFFIVHGNLNKKYRPFIALLFIISLVARSFLEYYSLHYHRQIFLGGSDFIDPSLVIVSASLFFLLYLSEDIFEHISGIWIRDKLSVISNATLGIYFVHYLFLNRAPLPILISTTSLIHISYNIDMFINAFIFFIISLVIILLLQKVPVIKNIIT